MLYHEDVSPADDCECEYATKVIQHVTVCSKKPCDGATGCDGCTGPPGPPGPQGPAGASGAAGSMGPAGATGSQGLSGPAGPTGERGPAGMSGASGDVGSTGPAGPSGAAGASGSPGPTGPSGPAGVDGASGAVGPAGLVGPSGAPGPAGPSGAGASGAVGPAGPAGADGATGPTGPAGATGADGASATGTDGATGPQGPTGPTADFVTRSGSSFSVWNFTPLTFAVNVPNVDLIRIATGGLSSMFVDVDSAVFEVMISEPFHGPIIVYHPVSSGPFLAIAGNFNITMNYVLSSPTITTGAINIGLGYVDSTVPPLGPITRLTDTLAVFSNSTVVTQTVGMSFVGILPTGGPDRYIIPFIDIRVPGGPDNVGGVVVYGMTVSINVL